MAIAYNRTEPCAECPFTRDGTSGCVTGKQLLSVIDANQAHLWPCHMERGQPREACVGATLFAKNVKVFRRVIDGFVAWIDGSVPPASPRVFETKDEFVSVYNRRPCLSHQIPAGNLHNAFSPRVKRKVE